ncbi:MAG: nucleoside phosphorylase [Oscillospiraceae bacterium]|jgi:uridine phosphorylase|nr:nucleoside phosphorylase [Oscillospiraceae bacterium]
MDERSYHTGIADSNGARYAILTGDPGRVGTIARLLENPRFLNQNREYVTWAGELSGEPALVTSTGIGGPSAAICVEELFAAGIRTFIRVGTCGGMASGVSGGDVVIANAAIRMEGTTKEYVPVEFPAVSDIAVTNALIEASKTSGARWHCGVVHCKDSFFGQHDPERMPAGHELRDKWRAWIMAGCLASEMESAAVFIVSQILGARAGCVLNVVWNQERERPDLSVSGGVAANAPLAAAVAVEAVRILIRGGAGASRPEGA